MCSFEGEFPAKLLPKRLQEFVELIGLTDTLKVLDLYKGRRLFIPKSAHDDHPLVELIGLEKLTVLCTRYGMEDHFDIPKADGVARHIRDALICGQYGVKSASVLAAEHNLTERHVYNIVAKCNKARKQRREAGPGTALSEET